MGEWREKERESMREKKRCCGVWIHRRVGTSMVEQTEWFPWYQAHGHIIVCNEKVQMKIKGNYTGTIINQVNHVGITSVLFRDVEREQEQIKQRM